MKQGIVSEAYINCNHCEGVACFAPLVLPVRFVWTQNRYQHHHTHCTHWNGCNIPQLWIAVKEGPLTWSGEFFRVLDFFKPFQSDGSLLHV